LSDQGVHPTASPSGVAEATLRPLPSLTDAAREPGVASRRSRAPNLWPLGTSWSDQFQRLVGELRERNPQTCELILARLTERFPDWEAESTFARTEVAAFLPESLDRQLRAFAADKLPPAAPADEAEVARAVARAGELGALLNTYRSAQAVLWETWFGLVEDSELAVADRRALLSRGSDFFFRYADLLADHVAAIYQSELERSSQSGENRRFLAIRSVLEGNSPDPSSSALEFDLDQHHLGLLAWGEGADDAVRQLAASLERPYLLTGPTNEAWWAWISGVRPFDIDEEHAVERFLPPPETLVAVGQPAFGEQGFRATHRQAQRAQWASRLAEQSLVRYADVAAESLACENSEEAQLFVARELRGIEDDSAASQRIRDTLLAYFESEHNAASAAARLGVHQQTIANRLRAVEERLGRSVGARRLELELALRLRATLAGGRS